MAKIKIDWKSTLDMLVHSVPIITATILVIEASKIIHYFYLRNFNIVPYLTTSFIISMFIGDLGWVIALILLPFLLIVVLFFIWKLILGRKHLTFNLKLFGILIVIPTAIGFLANHFASPLYGLDAGIVSFLIVLFFHSIFIPIPINRKVTKKDIEAIYDFSFETKKKSNISEQDSDEFKNIHKSIPLCLILSFFCVFTFSNIYMVYQFRTFYETRTNEIIFENADTLKARSHEFYIGKTPEYYFICNDTLNSVRVIKEADVKELRTNR